MINLNGLKEDQEIYRALERERRRQNENLELIASENIVSTAVLQAMGSILTNKYAEGYPNKRYYGGCQFVDEIETLAIERAKKLFHAEHANVQPHSGSAANQAVYASVLNPQDVILSLDLSHGGHLTHGSSVNFSGKMYQIVHYHVDPNTQKLDYEEIRSLAELHKPKLIVAGASAYSSSIDFRIFREIADTVNAYLMVDMAHIAGLVAANLHTSPVLYADFVTSTTHKTLRGPRGGLILCKQKYARSIDKNVFPGLQGGPLMHIIAAKAVCFKEAMTEEFCTYSKQVLLNAKSLVHHLQNEQFHIVSGGTDTHMLLVDLQNKNITGKQAEEILDQVNITCNKNTIPNDPNGVYHTSGIRLGTPAVTTRGMNEQDMEEIAQIIAMVLHDVDQAKLKAIERVSQLTTKYPII